MRASFFITGTVLLALGCGAAGFWRGRTERTGKPALLAQTANADSEKAKKRQDPEAAPAENTAAAFARRLEKVTAATELPGFYEALNQPAHEAVRPAWLELLCARWAELDPAGGRRFFQEKNDPAARARVLLEWALLDADTAILALAAEGEAGIQDAAQTGKLLLQEDPAVFWKWFQHWRAPLPEHGILSANWKAVTRAHAAELETLAATLLQEDDPAKQERDAYQAPPAAGLYALLAAVRAERDPAAAVQWAAQTPEPVRNAALREALTALGCTDPRAALAQLNLMKDRQTGARHYISSGADEVAKEIVRHMANQDMESILQLLKGDPEKGGAVNRDAGRILGMVVVEGWLPVPEAVRLMRDSGFPLNNLSNSLWQVMSSEQLEEAARFLQPQSAEPANRRMLTSLLSDWWKRDTAGAARFAGTLDGELQQELYKEIMQRSTNGTTDPSRVQRTLLQIPEEHRTQALTLFLDQARSHIFRGITSLADLSGYQTVLGNLPASAGRDKAVIALAQNWSLNDPEQALAWAGREKNLELRAEATAAAVGFWTMQDAWSASQWVQELPPGPERDAPAQALATHVAGNDPDSAWIWAGTITEPERRLQTQSWVLQQWNQADSAAAQAALEREAPRLSAADQGRLTQALQKGRR